MAQSVEYALVAAIASAIATFTMTEFGETVQKDVSRSVPSSIESLMDIAQRGGSLEGTGVTITLDPCGNKPATTAAR